MNVVNLMDTSVDDPRDARQRLEAEYHLTDWQRLVLRRGVLFSKVRTSFFSPSALTEQKQCFKNAMLLCSYYPGSLYCEGYATDPTLPIVFHHAWVVAEGEVIDPTWRQRDRCSYMGLLFPVDVAAGIVRTQGHYGLLENFGKRPSDIGGAAL
jgi:hypothetical protein